MAPARAEPEARPDCAWHLRPRSDGERRCERLRLLIRGSEQMGDERMGAEGAGANGDPEPLGERIGDFVRSMPVDGERCDADAVRRLVLEAEPVHAGDLVESGGEPVAEFALLGLNAIHAVVSKRPARSGEGHRSEHVRGAG
jgi:hypothetical protein